MMEEMTDRELISLLKSEEADAASYHDSELASEQAEAYDRYFARPFKDDAKVDGSRIVTHDLEDTINWLMPHLMRTFLQSKELISCDDPALDDDDPVLKTAADYLHHVVFKDNDGATFVHDFAFDGLLAKVGVSRVAWEEPKPKAPRIMEGVPATQLEQVQQSYEILEMEEGPPLLLEGQPIPTFALKVRKVPKMGRAIIEAIPPEEFRISRRAKSIREADYHGWRRHVFLAPILKEFPEHEDLLLAARDSDDPVDNDDPRVAARFHDEFWRSRTHPETLGRAKVEEHVEYIRCDYDGDGHVELRRIRRVGDVILENDAVDESEFSLWTPLRISHRAIGRSLADTLIDLQKIRSMLTRAALDGLSRSLLPRTVVNIDKLGTGALDAILDHDIGGVIPVKGPVGDAVQELTTPNVAPDALSAIEYFDRKAEEASGVNKHSQGIAPDAITQTAKGIEMLQTAANSRVEIIARWIGLGLEETLQKLLRLLVDRHDGERVIKVTGKQIAVDPSRWSDEMTVSVHVGRAGSSREEMLQSLMVIAQKQEQVIATAGPSGPLVTLPKLRATYAAMVEQMGFRSAERFFAEIPGDWQPPEPPPDPKIALEQQKAEAQKVAAEQKLQLEAQMGEQRLALERELAMMKMELERELAMMRLALERDMATRKIDESARQSDSKVAAQGFRPGGKLDA